MRRAFLAIMAMSLTGYFFVDAASVGLNATDIATFDTPVSLAPPPCQAQSYPGPIYIRTIAGDHVLDPAPPDGGGFDGQPARIILASHEPVQTQAAQGFYMAWRGPAAPGPCGMQLVGRVRALLWSNASGAAAITGALMACPPGAVMESVIGGGSTDCKQIAVSQADSTWQPGDYKVRVLRFGDIDTTILPDWELRLKIVNNTIVTVDLPVIGSTAKEDWELVWGYNSLAQRARLELSGD